MLDRVKTLSAVTSACLTETVPVSLDTGGVIFSLPAADGKSRVTGNAVKYVVGRDYFDTTAVPILLGRGFLKEDEANDVTAVIVTQEFMRRFWEGRDPLGRSLETTMSLLRPPSCPDHSKTAPPWRGKGVAWLGTSPMT
jgi:hypothetical protein